MKKKKKKGNWPWKGVIQKIPLLGEEIVGT